MGIRLLVPMDPAPGKREELKAAFVSLCPSVREEPGCEQYELFQSVENPDRLVLLERWTDQEALDAHGQRLRQRGLNLAPLRAGPSQVERYDG